MNRRSVKRHQVGLGLVSAIFVITVLALIAAGMAAIVANSAQSNSQQLLKIRAQSATLSALDIELVKLAVKPSCSSESTEIEFTSQGLNECRAVVSCSSLRAEGKVFLHVTSEGSCGSGADTAVWSEQKRILQQ